MLIDTNIFLEVFLGQERAEQCQRLLRQIERGETGAFITDFAAHSIAVILERASRGEALSNILSSLANFRGLTLLNASIRDQVEVALLASQTGLDFDDAYQAYFARKMSVPVVSFDRHFDGVVERREPQDFIEGEQGG